MVLKKGFRCHTAYHGRQCLRSPGWAKAAGVPVMLNPASATDLDDELLRLVTYLTPNEQEASVETGLPLAMEDGNPSRKDLEQIAAVLRSRGLLRGCFLCGIDSGADSGGGTGFCQPYRRYYRLTDGSNAIRAHAGGSPCPPVGARLSRI